MKIHTLETTLAAACLSIAASLMPSFVAAADADTQGSGEHQHRHGPPPEAKEACSGKEAQAACSFNGRDGETVSGTCEAPRHPPEGAASSSSAPELACRPAGMKGGRGRAGH